MPQEITNLNRLDIYEVTEEQYAALLESSEFDPNALYLTPDGGSISSIEGGVGILVSESSEGDVISLDSTYEVSANDISTGTDTDPKLVSAKTLSDSFSEVTIIRRWS